MTTGLVFGYKKADGGTQLFRGTAEPPPPATGAPRIRLTGLVGRTRAQTTTEQAWITAGATGGFSVVEVNWSGVQPTRGALSSARVTSLHADFDWAESLGLPVHLRVMCGGDAPTWAKALGGGPLPWEQNDATTGGAWEPLPGGIGNWTAPAYWDAYEDLQVRLAAEFGDEAMLAAVTMSLPMTNYAEPCIKEYTSPANRAAAKAAGTTTAKDLASFSRGWAIHKAVWSPHDVATSTAFNTHQGLTAGGALEASMARTTALMDEMRTTIGDQLTIWENNSLMALDTSMATMYDKMKAAHAADGITLHFQTRTVAKHRKAWEGGKKTSPLKTFELAIARGAQSCEVPAGGFNTGLATDGTTIMWPEISLVQAADLNARLAANVEVI